MTVIVIRCRGSTSTSFGHWLRAGAVSEDGRPSVRCFPDGHGRVESSRGVGRLGSTGAADVRSPSRARAGVAERFPLQLMTQKHHNRFLNSGYSHRRARRARIRAVHRTVRADAALAASSRVSTACVQRSGVRRGAARITDRVRPGLVSILGVGGTVTTQTDGRQSLTNDTLTEWAAARRSRHSCRSRCHEMPRMVLDRPTYLSIHTSDRDAGVALRYGGDMITRSESCAAAARCRRCGDRFARRHRRHSRSARRCSPVPASSRPANGGGSSSTQLASRGSIATALACADGTSTSNPFSRGGELLIGADIIDRKVGERRSATVAMRAGGDGRQTWCNSPRFSSRGAVRCVGDQLPPCRCRRVADLFHSAGSEVAAEVARLRDMHPATSPALCVRFDDPAQATGRGDGGRAACRPARRVDGGRATANHRGPRPGTSPSTFSKRWEYDDLADLLARCRASSAPGSSKRWTLKTPISTSAAELRGRHAAR